MRFQGVRLDMAGWGLATAVLFGSATAAFGVQAEVTREIRTGPEFTSMEFRSATEEMVRELAGHGCLSASVFASMRPDKPGTMVIVAKCTAWQETNPSAPVK
jgi:hypothetical protein